MSPSLDDKLTRISALKPARRPTALGEAVKTHVPLESDRLAELLGAVCRCNRYGEHLLVRRWFAEPEACVASPRAVRLLAPDAPAGAADPDQWLFLDTETTGLAGGTGTYAFLVGVAWWDAGGLAVEQFFMRDHTEEHSLLLELSKHLAERRTLVTFNGKSFDWPLLETRYGMTRAITPRAPTTHLDLLHPARQVWRLRLGSVRLPELERRVLARHGGLGWDRGRDVPSELIPQIYFDFLRGGPPEPLVAVFRHNQMDLRGLAALASRMLALLDDPERTESDSLELFGLSRLLRRRGETPRARRLYERALASSLPAPAGLPAALDRAARRELAALAKRERDFSRATSLWQELIQDYSKSYKVGGRSFSSDMNEGKNKRALAPEDGSFGTALEACEQLAIYYEHRARQPHRAAQFARQALAQLRQALRAGDIEPGRYRRLHARFDHRLARLSRKSNQVFSHSLAERRAAKEADVTTSESLKGLGDR